MKPALQQSLLARWNMHWAACVWLLVGVFVFYLIGRYLNISAHHPRVNTAVRLSQEVSLWCRFLLYYLGHESVILYIDIFVWKRINRVSLTITLLFNLFGRICVFFGFPFLCSFSLNIEPEWLTVCRPKFPLIQKLTLEEFVWFWIWATQKSVFYTPFFLITKTVLLRCVVKRLDV